MSFLYSHLSFECCGAKGNMISKVSNLGCRCQVLLQHIMAQAKIVLHPNWKFNQVGNQIQDKESEEFRRVEGGMSNEQAQVG